MCKQTSEYVTLIRMMSVGAYLQEARQAITTHKDFHEIYITLSTQQITH